MAYTDWVTGVTPISAANLNAGLRATTGSYTGNSSANRAIPHGLGRAPMMILLTTTVGAYTFLIMGASTNDIHCLTPTSGTRAVTAVDATNFYVGNSDSYVESANLNVSLYDWVAIG